MAKTIAVRINDKIEEIIKRNVEEWRREKKDQSDIIREFIQKGSLLNAIELYRKGEISIGRASYLADVPITAFLDILSDLGIYSQIDMDDLLESYEKTKKYF